MSLLRCYRQPLLHYFQSRPMSSGNRFFEDSDHTKQYSIFRPTPPDSLVQSVISYLSASGLSQPQAALDVGCGSGQSTLVLSPHFHTVYGIDISKAQIDEALQQSKDISNVHFSVAGDSNWPFEDSSLALVSTCQAIHWFDIQKFYGEVHRVLRPGGVLAVYGYSFTDPSPSVRNWEELTQLREEAYISTQPYWSPLRKLVDSEYKTIPKLPFSDFQRDESHFCEINGSLSDWLGYISTWSGYQQMKSKRGEEECKQFIDQFEASKIHFGTRFVQECHGHSHSAPYQVFPSPWEEAMITCEFCGEETFDNDRELSKHIQAIHSDHSRACPFCDLSGVTADEVNIHISATHPEQGDRECQSNSVDAESKHLDCPICPFQGKSLRALQQHINEEHFSEEDDASKEPRPGPSNIPKNTNQTCPICNANSNQFQCSNEFAKHVENHFSCDKTDESDEMLAQQIQAEEGKIQEEREFRKLQSTYGMDGWGSFKSQAISALERDHFKGNLSTLEFHEKKIELTRLESNGLDDGSTSTSDPLPAIRSAIASNKNINKIYLCSPVDHFHAAPGDQGWGCGYRNFQMLLSSLMQQELFKNLVPDKIPSITRIQFQIEEAWRIGIDPTGCEQLGGKVKGTRKWIGATEIASLLTSLKIKPQVIDFHKPTASDGSHPLLFEWVLKYFKDRLGRPTPPLFLQHQGHSRTIVGIEVLTNSSQRLLIFDPSNCQLRRVKSVEKKEVAKALGRLRHNLASLKHRQYQIVSIPGQLLNDENDFKRAKTIVSTRIP